MGRPPTRPGKLRDGFYIEVRTKGAKSGIKLWSETLGDMKKAAVQYAKTKEVNIMGEYKNGKPVKPNKPNKPVKPVKPVKK